MASTAILFGDDTRLHAVIGRVLGDHGWTVTVAGQADQALAPDIALMILVAAVRDATDVIQHVRAGPAPASGVPILQHGGTRLAGVNAVLPPLDDVRAVAAGISVFTGALGDHALRRPPFSPFYRLVRLLGMPDATATFGRFAKALHDAIADPATCTDAEQAHRLAGLAGAIGFAALSLAWRNAEQGDAACVAHARAMTRTTLDEIETGDPARYL